LNAVAESLEELEIAVDQCELLRPGPALDLSFALCRLDRRLTRESGQTRKTPEYAPRRPETTILFRAVQHELQTWLGNARTRERTVL
jgi:hypothetical protein